MKNHYLSTRVAYVLATCCGVGYAPVMPGTVCSLVTVIIFFMLPALSWVAWGIFFAITFGVGTWASSIVEKCEEKKDPSIAVIDEVLGQGIVLCAVPKTLVGYALAFVLFRFFDISKAWPACLVERRVPGGLGIMLDDVVAGLWATVACLLIFY